jgi:hypothetical protein
LPRKQLMVHVTQPSIYRKLTVTNVTARFKTEIGAAVPDPELLSNLNSLGFISLDFAPESYINNFGLKGYKKSRLNKSVYVLQKGRCFSYPGWFSTGLSCKSPDFQYKDGPGFNFELHFLKIHLVNFF